MRDSTLGTQHLALATRHSALGISRALAGVLLGVAAWFSLGAHGLPPRGSPHFVVGLLPPLWTAVPLACAGCAFAILCRKVSIGLVLLPALALVPWLGARVPAALLWGGPFVLFLWALLLVPLGGALRAHSALTSVKGLILSAAFVVATFGCAAARAGISGDEPHYLLIAQSVLEDGDLDLANNYEPSRYRAFYPGLLQTRHTVFGKSRREYSFHGVGVPLLVLPAFAVAGVSGAHFVLGIVTIVGVATLWRCIRELTSDTAAAAAGVASLVFQLPFLAQATAIYPDGTAAAATSITLLALVALETSVSPTFTRLLGAGAALGLLPWMHLRLALIAVILGIAIVLLLVRRQNRASRLIIFVTVPAISAIVFFAASMTMFGTLDPTAAFRQRVSGSLSGLPVGAAGLLFDREYGLLVFAPAMFFGAIGWRELRRRVSVTAWSGLVVVIATLLTSASFVWWGGTSAPARFLVPVLPVLSVSIGAWWTRATPLARAACIAAIVVGAVPAFMAAVADRGVYVTNVPDGGSTIFDWANHLVSIESALPSFVKPLPSIPTEISLVVAWMLSAVVITWCARTLARSARARVDLWTTVAYATVVLASGGVTAAWAVRRVNPVTSDRSQLNLLLASAREGLTTPWIDDRVAPDFDEVLSALAFGSPESYDPRILLHVPNPPAGRYRIEVAPRDDDRSLAGSLTLQADREGNRLWVWPLASPDEAPSLTTVIPVHSFRVIATDATAAERVSVRLRPLGRDGLPKVGAKRAEQVARFGDALVYFLDPGVAVESGGFWLVANRQTAIVCTTLDGSRGCRELSSEAGDQAVRVRVIQDDWNSVVALDPRGTRNVTLPGTSIQVVKMEATTATADRNAAFISVPRPR